MKSLIATITAASALLAASYALADGPPAKTPPPAAPAAKHDMCGGMKDGKMPAGKGHAAPATGAAATPMAKADHDKMCGGAKMGHGGMAMPKSGAHAPAPKADPPKAHEHE